MNDAEREMYEFASNLVRSAGFKLKRERAYSALIVKEKSSHMDLVTEHDLAIEKYLTEAICAKYRGHRILAEESQALAKADGQADSESSRGLPMSGKENEANYSGYRWVIDPIDGTINYYRFGKDYAISLAVYYGENPVFGLVYDVANDVMFSAGQGEGAIVNGCAMPSLPESRHRLAQAVVGMSLRTMREFSALGTDVLGLLSRVQAHRYLGCASLELCKVATGDYDLFISSNVYEWDIAAARVFLEQRGVFFLSRRKDAHNSGAGKLLVAAFRSPALWQEALGHLSQSVRAQLVNF